MKQIITESSTNQAPRRRERLKDHLSIALGLIFVLGYTYWFAVITFDPVSGVI